MAISRAVVWRLVLWIGAVGVLLVVLGWIVGPFFSVVLITAFLAIPIFVGIGVLRGRIGWAEAVVGGVLTGLVGFGITVAGYSAPMTCTAPNGAPHRLVLTGPSFVPGEGRENGIGTGDDGSVTISLSLRSNRPAVARGEVLRVDAFTDPEGGVRALEEGVTLLVPLDAVLASTRPVAEAAANRVLDLDGVPVFEVVEGEIVPAGVLWGSVRPGEDVKIAEASYRLARPRIGGTEETSRRALSRWTIDDWRDTIFAHRRPGSVEMHRRAVREGCLPSWLDGLVR